MKHIAAYLLLVVGGNAAPSADDVKGVLSSVGIEADADALTRLVGALEGKVRASPAYPEVLSMVCCCVGMDPV